jgi:hypothetical protein
VLVVALGVSSLVGLSALAGPGDACAATVPDPVDEAIAASAAPGHDWSPERERYGVSCRAVAVVGRGDQHGLVSVSHGGRGRGGRLVGGDGGGEAAGGQG